MWVDRVRPKQYQDRSTRTDTSYGVPPPPLAQRLAQKRPASPPQPVQRPAPPRPIQPRVEPLPDDVLYELITAPAIFVARVNGTPMPEYKRTLLLQLAARSEQELVNDFIANWYILHTGASPIEHDYHPVPDHYLPAVDTVDEFNQFLADYRKKRAGVTPAKTVRVSCKANFVLRDSAITEWSNVTVELVPEIVEVENGVMSFYLQPNGYDNLLVTIRN